MECINDYHLQYAAHKADEVIIINEVIRGHAKRRFEEDFIFAKGFCVFAKVFFALSFFCISRPGTPN